MIDRELEFDDRVFVFETVMRVRNTEIDVGQHLTLESLIALLAEARARFLYSKGIKEINAECQGLIVSNLQLNIISRVRAREELLFEVGIEQISDKNGEMAIKVTRMYDGSLVAKARKSFVQYDYRSNRSISFNNDIEEALNQQPFEL
ncbi:MULTISPECIES: acyl-CoA thioesterase [unclassified Psychrobacter]|uniref:acyl-CoA thioesterase n=1 Tax=unclassified Psychrobacter TaxID=196806 RepID=UPI00071E6E96|nr:MULTISPECIES: thioesterase family protein [unclassified Psychrobacter]OLF36688.1 thioesterase [Psychrobacter sp. Cmf 22.2]